MNVPEKLEVPVVVKDTDGNEHEVERLVYRLERNGNSRWHELFGTPEMAARTLADKQLVYAMQEYDALLEWLRGDA